MKSRNMSENIFDKEFKNWVRGNFALNATKDVLCKCTEDNLNKFVESIGLSCQNPQLAQFMNCLEKNSITKLAKLQKRPKKRKDKSEIVNIECEHANCVNLMAEFVSIHRYSLKDCYVWTTSAKNPSHPMIKHETDEMIWKLSSLYMQVNKGDDTKCKGLEDLDISKIIKIMRNCTKLCSEPCKDHLEKVLDWRNTLMHSADHTVNDRNIRRLLEDLQQLLESLKTDSTAYIKSAKKKVQRILENDIYIGEMTAEIKQIFTKIGRAKKMAADLNSSLDTDTTLQSKSNQLLELLDICQIEETPLRFEPLNYKETIETFLTNQIKAIDSDLESYDTQSVEYTELQKTRASVEIIKKKLESEKKKDTLFRFMKASQKQSIQNNTSSVPLHLVTQDSENFEGLQPENDYSETDHDSKEDLVTPATLLQKKPVLQRVHSMILANENLHI